MKTGEPLFEPFRVIKRGDLKIGITGLISASSTRSPDYEIRDYLDTGRKILAELEMVSDIQVVLVNAPGKDFRNLKKELPGADYIFTSGGIKRTSGYTPQKSEEPLLYSSQKQGKYVTDIHLELNDPEQPVTDASGLRGRVSQLTKQLDRFQDKDPEKTFQELYGKSPNLLRLIEKYQLEIEENENLLASAMNTNEFHSVPMGRKLKDHPDYTALVEKALSLKN